MLSTSLTHPKSNFSKVNLYICTVSIKKQNKTKKQQQKKTFFYFYSNTNYRTKGNWYHSSWIIAYLSLML